MCSIEAVINHVHFEEFTQGIYILNEDFISKFTEFITPL